MAYPSSFWRDRTTLVTGATGLVGSWLVPHLANLGADVVCLVRDWVPQSELNTAGIYNQVKVVRGDVRDQNLMEQVLGEYEINTVFHLAAQTTVNVANNNPVSTFESNIAGTWRLLEASRRSPEVKQIIIASSDKAYGEQPKLPYIEEMPLQGSHPYDVSKSCADLIAQTYALSYGLPVIITRCANFYGGGDLNWNRLVPGTIRSILRHQRPVIRSDGNYIRDYFFVEDGVLAYTLLAEKFAQNPGLKGQAFNFSLEKQVSVLELVKQILTQMGSNLEPDIRNQSTNEIRSQYLSSNKAKEILGWSPAFTLEEGLQRTIKWYQTFFRNQNG